MPELIPAAPGTPDRGRLTIYYRQPLTRDVWPFSLEPGSSISIHPVAGYVVDHFSITILPEVPDA